MVDLQAQGLTTSGCVYRNLAPAELVEMALARGEGKLADNGSLVAYTGTHTGRAARDKYIVREPSSQAQIDWSPTHQAMQPEVFDRILAKVKRYHEERDLFIIDGWADAAQRLTVRVIADKAWHALFSQCLLLRPPLVERAMRGQPEYLTIFAAPDLLLDPQA